QERRLVRGILTAARYSPEDADTISKVITHSDFTGVYSHGLSRLTRYLNQIEKGALNPHPEFSKVLDDGPLLVFDGDNGSGIVSVNRAYEAALEKARTYGVAVAAGRRNANIGCGSYYGWRAVQDDMICVLTCNTYAFAAPYGGADRLIGTNPIIAAVPTGEEYPMILDISTTNVAMGKIQAAEREGAPIPANWANDYDGRPTTDPAQAYALTPIAAHKGYGLAVMAEALSTLLSGAAYGTDVGLFSKLEKENTGFFLLLIDPSRFMPLEDFKRSADRYIRMLKSSRRAAGVDEIFLPGEIEQRKFRAFMESGVEVSEALQAELTALSRRLGVAFEGDRFEDLLRALCG
ncbi:MAG: Ldh family oxidoreductase, partial [Oscillospiraceae bacterium]|nr:Ldh family oxidoreductase [Oscillospiraceae bacterium]